MLYFDYIAFAAECTGEEMQTDALKFISALQGLVNRSGPSLYINAIKGADRYWLEKFTGPDGFLSAVEIRTLPDIDALLDAFAAELRGLVIWDPDVPATSNVASVICAVDGWLPAAVRDGGFYERYLKPRKIPVKCDLRGMFTGAGLIPGSTRASTGSAKCDAYVWAKENYLDKGLCNDALMAYMTDTFPWRKRIKFDYDNAMLANHDYFIAHKAFVFDLSPWGDEVPNDDPGQPLGCDLATLKELLLAQYQSNGGKKMTSIGGFVPWHLKYTAFDGNGTHGEVYSEWQYAEVISAYNAFMDAEAYGLCGMANASVFMHHPLKPHYENTRPAASARLEDKTYLMFYMGDYDSAAWVSRKMPDLWDDPARGEVPLAWQFNPNLSDRAPHAFDYIYRTKTPNDYIIAGDSGAGYVNPTYLLPPRVHSDLPSGMDVWIDHCKKYYDRFDISITGFILNGLLPVTEESVRDYAELSPDGCSYYIYRTNPGLPEFIGGVPFVGHTAGLEVTPDKADKMIDLILRKTQGATLPDFRMFRLVLQKPSDVRDFMAKLKDRAPEKNFELTDPYTFYRLFKESRSKA